MKQRALAAVTAAFALGLMLATASCGGSGAGPEAQIRTGAIAPVQILETTSHKVTSGPPVGIYVTWTRSTDSRATGYYLYRDTQSIPDPPEGEDLPPGLRTNDGMVIPQPDDGETVTFNDFFPVVIGQEYFYRVTVLNNDDPPQESYPSNEMSWVVHGHNVGNVTPDTAYWGDDVVIDGDTFGAYDIATDSVHFTSVDGGTIEGAVVNWDDTEITATVPIGADTGPVFILIDGTQAQTDNDLTILSPLINSLSPAEGFLEQPLSIIGKNFGAEQLDGTVFMGGVDITTEITVWGDTQIDLVVPVSPGGGAVYVVGGGRTTNEVVFTARPEVFDATPDVQSGEVVTLSGRQFGAVEGVVLLDGSEPMGVFSWSEDTIEATLIGSTGPHTITVVRPDAVASNDFDYSIIPELAVTLSGLDAGAFYTVDDAPAIGVDTAADADKVELLVDGEVLAESTAAPFDDMVLPVALLTNDVHEVALKAYRRTITAESLPVVVGTYSLVGDINGDGVVDATDRDALEALIGLTDADEDFFPWYDTDGDGEVTEADLSAVGYNFGNELATP
jgi:hypothetical protein